jgi:hypothetical protein
LLLLQHKEHALLLLVLLLQWLECCCAVAAALLLLPLMSIQRWPKVQAMLQLLLPMLLLLWLVGDSRTLLVTAHNPARY